jgi:hypothetical protein
VIFPSPASAGGIDIAAAIPAFDHTLEEMLRKGFATQQDNVRINILS